MRVLLFIKKYVKKKAWKNGTLNQKLDNSKNESITMITNINKITQEGTFDFSFSVTKESENHLSKVRWRLIRNFSSRQMRTWPIQSGKS